MVSGFESPSAFFCCKVRVGRDWEMGAEKKCSESERRESNIPKTPQFNTKTKTFQNWKQNKEKNQMKLSQTIPKKTNATPDQRKTTHPK